MYPMLKDWMELPRYANPSTTPAQVAVALRPPKSVAAVPDMSEVIPTEHITMATPDIPTSTGDERSAAAITSERTRTRPQSMAAGGPRRDWKHLSETSPAPKPPMIPNMQRSQPQCARKNPAPGCLTSFANTKYHCEIPLRNIPEVSSTTAIISMSGLVKTFRSRSAYVRCTCIWPDEAS